MGDDLTPRAAIERLFSAEPAEDWFTPAFAAQVPPERVRQIVADLTGRYGRLEDVRESGEGFAVSLERADIPTQIVLDGDGRIAGLLFRTPVVTSGSLDQHVATIAALPGRTAVLVVSDGAERAAHDAATPLAVGSAAKLAIVKAVKDAVTGGRLGWEQVVMLDSAWRSLPTGILQDWPPRTPVTIATLVNLAVSISDNTAADALLHTVGREAVEAISPRNRPFLATRELFQLKMRTNADLRAAWAVSSAVERRSILDRLSEKPEPRAAALERSATSDVEWHLSAVELCDLLAAVADLEAFRINPGLADPAAWARVAYKGGSEAGVLNLSTLLVAADGTRHCVIATWNDAKTLDEQRLMVPYRAILEALARQQG